MTKTTSLLDPSEKLTPEEKLKEKMSEIDLKEKETITKNMAAKLSLPYIDLTAFPIGPEILRLVAEEKAKKEKILCFFHHANQIRLATTRPDNPEIENIISDLQRQFPGSKASIYLTSKHSLNSALKLYKSITKIRKIERDIKITQTDLEQHRGTIGSFADLSNKLPQVNMTEAFSLLIAAAINFDASDIHIEAEEENVKVRFRLDGVLHDVAVMPPTLWPRVINRIKAIAHLKINIKNKPQDGRITIKLKGEQIDIRVSTLPSAFGESVVMRLLKTSSVNLDFEVLGLSPEEAKKLQKQIHRPNGMIITTGPTGSGKTTTLYAALNKLNTPETKIITLEEPIEYKIKGITQSQVDHAKGYGFAKGLRAILRQDPDIVMVGEIRDLETADTAIQAALTGHLMLSTVHTNDAAGAVPRMLSMGVKPFLLAPALNAVIGQRLVRRICPDCKTEEHLSSEKLERAKKLLSKIPANAGMEEVDTENIKFYKGQGCAKCHKIGYQGRIGIYEIFIVDRDIEAVILSQEISEYTMRDAAISKGMITMVQDGLLKASKGITSVDEVFRVTE